MSAGGRLLVLLAASVTVGTAAATITIDNNGYAGVLVGISMDVPEDQGRAIIDAIQVMFRGGSQALFNATEHRAYFKNVTIVVPATWNNFSVDRESYSDVYEDSNLRVAAPNPAFGDNPYTLQPGGCGEPGKYIHVTPGYLKDLDSTSTQKYGPPGKVLTHEWAHLRYGVFEEYGYPGDDTYPMFYYKKADNGESELTPNSCTNKPLDGYKMDGVTGGDCTYNDTTGLPDANCYFYPYEDNTAVSSLMSYTYIDSVNHFCNSSENKYHQVAAPTKQNFRCSYKSVWEVITGHTDFSNGKNLPSQLGPDDIEPVFETVRPAAARFVMVLDTSGSMQADHSPLTSNTHRIKKLHNAATKWIKYELQNGTWVSIVTFTDEADLGTPFIQIVDDASRSTIATFIPSTAVGGTCICNGIQEALKVLKKTIGTGGVMVLMTDGLESQNCINNVTGHHWNLTDLYDPVVAAGVRVVTMAFGTLADPRLERFADISGGSTYFISDETASLDLDQAFQECLTYQPDITVQTEKDILLFQQHFSGSTVQAFTGMFSIDPTTGRDLVFKIEYEDASTESNINSVKLVSPSGDTYSNISYNEEDNFGTIKLEYVEEGDWTFSVSFKHSSTDVIITTTSKARSTEVLPLTAECWIGTQGDITVTASTLLSVLAKVRQGDNTVLSATVTAHVTTPSATAPVVDMVLLDNGVGADSIADDGIYSKYFTQFDEKGRYAVVCEVKNDGKAVINEGFSASGVAPNPAVDLSDWCCGSRTPVGNNTRPTGNFTRKMSAGAFKTTNDVTANMLPPAQVTDLLMAQRNCTSGEVTVTWTAPGADLDYGTADRYEFKWSNDSNDLLPAMYPTHDEVVNSSLVPLPQPSGSRQNLTINSAEPDQLTIYLAMRTADKQGSWSAVSNTAILFLGATPTPQGGGGVSTAAIAVIVVSLVVLLVAM